MCAYMHVLFASSIALRCGVDTTGSYRNICANVPGWSDSISSAMAPPSEWPKQKQPGGAKGTVSQFNWMAVNL